MMRTVVRVNVQGPNRDRDNQRQRVYDWENKNLRSGVAKLTLMQCYELIVKAHDLYGLIPPDFDEISDGRGTRNAFVDNSSGRINLPLWARIPSVVLHESAHRIIQEIWPRRGDRPAHHGPEFVAIMINLLDHLTTLKGPELRRSARAAKVKIAASVDVPASLSRSEVKRLAVIRARVAEISKERDKLAAEASSIRRKTRTIQRQAAASVAASKQ